MVAMIREFNEEAGLTILDWIMFCILTDNETYEVHCYFSFSDEKPKTMTDEEVVWYNVDSLPSDVMSNLSWLIPMALSFDGTTYETYIVKESCLKVKVE